MLEVESFALGPISLSDGDNAHVDNNTRHNASATLERALEGVTHSTFVKP